MSFILFWRVKRREQIEGEEVEEEEEEEIETEERGKCKKP